MMQTQNVTSEKRGLFSRREPVVALVLSSGGARGWAHLGVIRTLEEWNIPIHMITGTSIGSVIGAMYASGSLDRLEQFAKKHKSFSKTISFMDLTLNSKPTGLVQGKKLMELIGELLPDQIRKFEDLSIPMGMVSVDLIDQYEVRIRKGDLLSAIRASISIPGFLEPYSENGRMYVDGALSNPVPVDMAYEMGADITIAVDFHRRDQLYQPGNMQSIMSQSLDIILGRLTDAVYENHPPHIRIDVDLQGRGFFDYHKSEELIRLGREAALVKIPEIQRWLKHPPLFRRRKRSSSHDKIRWIEFEGKDNKKGRPKAT